MSLGEFESFLVEALCAEKETFTDKTKLTLKKPLPVELVVNLIEKYCRDKDIVLEKEGDVPEWLTLTCCENSVITEMTNQKETGVSDITLDYF